MNTETREGDTIALGELRVGDKVLVDNEGNYDYVYSIAHRQFESPQQFLQIHHEHGRLPLEVTPTHLVFVVNATEGRDKPLPVVAADITKGQYLLSVEGRLSNVTLVQTVTRTGFVGVHTFSGTIVVQGVVCSSYAADIAASAVVPEQHGQQLTHAFFHYSLSYHRLLCRTAWSFICENESHDDDGVALPLSVAFPVYRWWSRQSPSLRMVLAGAAFVFLLPVYVLDNLVHSAVLARESRQRKEIDTCESERISHVATG